MFEGFLRRYLFCLGLRSFARQPDKHALMLHICLGVRIGHSFLLRSPHCFTFESVREPPELRSEGGCRWYSRCSKWVAAGWPPCSLTDHTAYLAALGSLIDRSGLTQRALARKAALTRSTLGDVLRDEIGLRLEVARAIVNTCEVGIQARDAWEREWKRLVLPELRARRQRRAEGFHAFYGGRW